MSSWELDASCGMLCSDLCIFLGRRHIGALVGFGGKLALEGARRVLLGRGGSFGHSAVIECGCGRGLVSGIGIADPRKADGILIKEA